MQSIESEKKQPNSSSLDELDRFEKLVSNALFHDSLLFKQLLYRWLHFELTPNQTSRILVVCRSFERSQLKTPLRFCRSVRDIVFLQKTSNDSNHASNVATLLGVVHYLGAGIQQDDKLAKHYFELAVSLDQKDAWIFLGIMARKGHGLEGGKPHFSCAWDCFQRASVDNLNPEAQFQQADMFSKGEISKDKLNDQRLSGFLSIKALLQKGMLEGEKLKINLGVKRQIDAVRLIKVIENLESNGVHHDDESLKSHVNESIKKIKRTPIKYDSHSVFLEGDPYGLVAIARASVVNAEKNSEILSTIAQYFLRAYLTCLRLRQEAQCEVIKTQFNEIMDNPAFKENKEYGFILYCFGVAVNAEFLKEMSADQGFDTIVRFYLLSDHITSRRSRMQWVLLLLDGKIPELYTLAGKTIDRKKELRGFLYRLGELAIEAVDDCLELADKLEGKAKDDLIAEAKKCWLFAEAIRCELQAEDARVSETVEESDKRIPFSSQNLYKYIDHVLESRLSLLLVDKEAKSMSHHGFSTALQFLMGSIEGGHILDLSSSPHLALFSCWIIQHCHFFHAVQKKQCLSDYGLQEIIFYLLIYSAVPAEARDRIVQEKIQALTQQWNRKSLSTLPEKTLLSKVSNNREDFLKRLQEYFDFCRLIDFSQSLQLKQQLNNAEKFDIFRQNRRFIATIRDAIKEYESYQNQPSSINFLSSTYGMDYEYQIELSKAKELLKQCESNVFNQIKITQAIFEFLSKKPSNVYSIRFVDILVKLFSSRFNYSFNLKELSSEEAQDRFRNAFKAEFLPSNIIRVSDFSL